MKVRLFIGAAVAAAVATSTGSAHAAAPPDDLTSEEIAAAVYEAPDPARAFAGLPVDQQAEFQERMAGWTAVEAESVTWQRPPTKAESAAMKAVAPGLVAAAGGCWSQYKYYKWYDLWINTGDTWMTASWCSNGSSITSYSLSNRGGQGYKGIKYEGLGQKYTSNVGWEVRQAQTFKFSVLWANANPCMQIRGGRTGLYSFRANCNLG